MRDLDGVEHVFVTVDSRLFAVPTVSDPAEFERQSA